MKFTSIPLSEMDIDRFPYRQHAKTRSEDRISARPVETIFKTAYDREVAIKHHLMTVNLAIGREVSYGL